MHMEYRNVGKSGLKISELSFGSWITFGSSLDFEGIKACMRIAFENGVNFFDNAEAYGYGTSELLMGEALRDYKRENLVISTKIFWGGMGPNQTGLSWKHLVEGTKNSLRRLQIDYVDLLFCHRPDPSTPIEETVRAMDVIIRSGLAFYWGTSEWSAGEIEKARAIALQYNAFAPIVEQPQYNMLHRSSVEVEYAHLYGDGDAKDSHGLGLTTWSPLASGILTGKYNDGIQQGSRLSRYPDLAQYLTPETLGKVKALSKLARTLDCTVGQLSIAWCLKNPRVSSVITGASSPQQVQENMQAVRLKKSLTEEVMQEIERILGSGAHA